ncbi:MAG TPA: hypothetical protein VD948_12895 [Rhodothermales bacterium]|nr:hypothetical protein [Rhodothermales bacterium]
MTVTAIVQARMGSTRLPGKVLLPLGESCVLGVLLERLTFARSLDCIALAVPDDQYAHLFNAWLRAYVGEQQARLIVGSEEDVLDRYWRGTNSMAGDDLIVRITADCPLVMPEVVDVLVEKAQRGPHAYVCTGESYPEGLDVEVFTKAALDLAWAGATGPEREHVTLWMRRHLTNQKVVELPQHYGHIRVTLDYEADHEVLRGVVGYWGSLITLDELLKGPKELPDLFAKNAMVNRNEWKEKAGA